MSQHFLIGMLGCRRQLMVGGGGESISPTLFCEKPDENDSISMTNRYSNWSIRLSPNYFYGENAKAFAAAIVAVKASSKYKVKDKTILVAGS